MSMLGEYYSIHLTVEETGLETLIHLPEGTVIRAARYKGGVRIWESIRHWIRISAGHWERYSLSLSFSIYKRHLLPDSLWRQKIIHTQYLAYNRCSVNYGNDYILNSTSQPVLFTGQNPFKTAAYLRKPRNLIIIPQRIVFLEKAHEKLRYLFFFPSPRYP